MSSIVHHVDLPGVSVCLRHMDHRMEAILQASFRAVAVGILSRDAEQDPRTTCIESLVLIGSDEQVPFQDVPRHIERCQWKHRRSLAVARAAFHTFSLLPG